MQRQWSIAYMNAIFNVSFQNRVYRHVWKYWITFVFKLLCNAPAAKMFLVAFETGIASELKYSCNYKVVVVTGWTVRSYCSQITKNYNLPNPCLLGRKLKIGHEEFVAKGSFTFRPVDDPFSDLKMWKSHQCLLILESMEVEGSSVLLLKRWFNCSVETIFYRSNILVVDKSTGFRMCWSALSFGQVIDWCSHSYSCRIGRMYLPFLYLFMK